MCIISSIFFPNSVQEEWIEIQKLPKFLMQQRYSEKMKLWTLHVLEMLDAKSESQSDKVMSLSTISIDWSLNVRRIMKVVWVLLPGYHWIKIQYNMVNKVERQNYEKLQFSENAGVWSIKNFRNLVQLIPENYFRK